MIALRSLFESYHNAVSHLEDVDLVEAGEGQPGPARGRGGEPLGEVTCRGRSF